ncbi:MAG: hypothetical protein GJ678_13115 [Rhodobacteraceae bacterium]|nr:hypothetical protein [Paracoccaceae bacterium]
MFDIPQPATALHRFAQDLNQSIQHAALLLGGSFWLRRVQRLLDDLASPRPLTHRILRETQALHVLLSLEHVHDMERVEAACFALLDPDAPYVAEICLLTEGLSEALEQTAAPGSTVQTLEQEVETNG